MYTAFTIAIAAFAIATWLKQSDITTATKTVIGDIVIIGIGLGSLILFAGHQTEVDIIRQALEGSRL